MSINKNTGPVNDNGQGQSSPRSFVRGGQTTVHSLRMFGQVIGVVTIAVAAIVSCGLEIACERHIRGEEVVTHGILKRLLNGLGVGDG